MARNVDKLAEEIRDLPDVEKLRLLDAILTDLDKPDPEIDRVWAVEARKRLGGSSGLSLADRSSQIGFDGFKTEVR
jgi:hypothetical protein